MHAAPFLLSNTADRLLKASSRLQTISHEPWNVDWERFALVCRHGATISCTSALGDRSTNLLLSIGRQHADAKGLRHRS